ncbi:gluconokinase [Galbitalea soli]|uniref:Gluconokinase n=1 Tax=Galbitalea soli TaxID=1268042 RepID=A0A7C9TQ30_9MICO|nr:gluconokinase [Galbitalea soli]NEM90935.1 gluconokinase [Galbitalea soli]NYJ29621.1 gluconokinase [Galbitalea soli]
MTQQLPPLVVMGVSGAGKSTVGAELARRAGLVFLDGDDLHPPRNVARMAAGHPLSDDDRWPWLEAVGAQLAAGRAGVIACSALRRAYRDRIRALAPDAYFVHLDGGHELIASRLEARDHAFMPASLLSSQFETLEPLQDDEAGLVVALETRPETMGQTGSANAVPNFERIVAFIMRNVVKSGEQPREVDDGCADGAAERPRGARSL